MNIWHEFIHFCYGKLWQCLLSALIVVQWSKIKHGVKCKCIHLFIMPSTLLQCKSVPKYKWPFARIWSNVIEVI